MAKLITYRIQPTTHLRGGRRGGPLFLLSILVFLGATVVFGGLVHSDIILFTQSDWKSVDAKSATPVPQADWSEYSARDVGVAASDDIRLEPAVYAVTQTSNDGIADGCDTENCSAGGGFNGATAVKAGTEVSGNGENAGVQLSAQTSVTEWSQQLLGTYDTHDASGIALAGNMVFIADESKGQNH